MVRTTDYESRRRAVLAKTISKYIEDAEPIASDDIAEAFDLSSATIRNIFTELEDAGYIMHQHTSGGRIPTSKGYRYYVDFLLSRMELLDKEKEHIVDEYRSKINRFDEALEKTSEVISAITHYASIVSFLEHDERVFYKGLSHILEQPEFRDIDKLRIMIKMIEDKEQLLGLINREFSGPVKVYIGEELGCPEMENCSLIVTSYSVKNRPTGRVAVLGPKRMEYERTIPKLEYISIVLTDVLDRI